MSKPAVLEDPERWFTAMEYATALVTSRLYEVEDLDQATLLEGADVGDVVAVLTENLVRIFSQGLPERLWQQLVRSWAAATAFKGANTP
jgi:hypothetical protein